MSYVLSISRHTFLISMLFILLDHFLIPQSLASYQVTYCSPPTGPRSPLLILIVTVIWSLAQLPLYPLKFIAALLLTAQSIIILSTLMLGTLLPPMTLFIPPHSKALSNISLSRSIRLISVPVLFKPGYSTTLCGGGRCFALYPSRFLCSGVFFDLVDHGMLFDKLITRGLPVSIVRFLSSWYYAQKMCARWNSPLSDSFHVSNCVRQGGVLSPTYVVCGVC